MIGSSDVCFMEPATGGIGNFVQTSLSDMVMCQLRRELGMPSFTGIGGQSCGAPLQPGRGLGASVEPDAGVLQPTGDLRLPRLDRRGHDLLAARAAVLQRPRGPAAQPMAGRDGRRRVARARGGARPSDRAATIWRSITQRAIAANSCGRPAILARNCRPGWVGSPIAICTRASTRICARFSRPTHGPGTAGRRDRGDATRSERDSPLTSRPIRRWRVWPRSDRQMLRRFRRRAFRRAEASIARIVGEVVPDGHQNAEAHSESEPQHPTEVPHRPHPPAVARRCAAALTMAAKISRHRGRAEPRAR